MIQLTVQSHKRCEFIDITGSVSNAVQEAGIKEGILVIFCPHTTAGITINENADPSVPSDIALKSSKLINQNDPDYRHGEGNSDSHIKSSLFGLSETVIIENGRLVLGTWQGIFFTEFDGPRTRKVFLKILSG
jgi:secondary thiamine-phosphate synthase enzyme